MVLDRSSTQLLATRKPEFKVHTAAAATVLHQLPAVLVVTVSELVADSAVQLVQPVCSRSWFWPLLNQSIVQQINQSIDHSFLHRLSNSSCYVLFICLVDRCINLSEQLRIIKFIHLSISLFSTSLMSLIIQSKQTVPWEWAKWPRAKWAPKQHIRGAPKDPCPFQNALPTESTSPSKTQEEKWDHECSQYYYYFPKCSR